MAKVKVTIQTIIDRGDPRDLTPCELKHSKTGKHIGYISRIALFDQYRVIFVGDRQKTPLDATDVVIVDYLDEKQDVIERWLSL